MWSDDDMRAFCAAVREAGGNPEDALLVYAFESSLNPHAVNPTTHAQGLAQLMPETLRGLGYTGDPLTFHTLSLQGQLPWIAALIRSQVGAFGGPIPNAAKWLHLQLSPASARLGTRVYSRGQAGYAYNAKLDFGSKGYIDESDLMKALNSARGARYIAALEQLRSSEAA